MSNQELGLADVLGLGLAIVAGADIEDNGLTFVEGLETIDFDFAEVDEQIVATLLSYETIALVSIEPLDCTICHS